MASGRKTTPFVKLLLANGVYGYFPDQDPGLLGIFIKANLTGSIAGEVSECRGSPQSLPPEVSVGGFAVVARYLALDHP